MDFLRYNDFEYLYLVGDIIDGWQLRRSWYWNQWHNDVRKIRARHEKVHMLSLCRETTMNSRAAKLTMSFAAYRSECMLFTKCMMAAGCW
jgi:UDP-2,3-diacylglucosamine pyrophosphatase LpxH